MSAATHTTKLERLFQWSFPRPCWLWGAECWPIQIAQILPLLHKEAGSVRRPISSLNQEKSNCLFLDLTNQMFWLLDHKSTKASVTVLKHIQSNCINFRTIARSTVSEGKTENGNYVVFPLPEEMNPERNGWISSDFLNFISENISEISLCFSAVVKVTISLIKH